MKTHPINKIAPHSNTRVILIHAKAIETLDDFYKDIQVALEIPDYFGYNLDALEEVLSDLSWIKEPHAILIIYRSELLLSHRSDERDSLISVLIECNNPSLDILFL